MTTDTFPKNITDTEIRDVWALGGTTARLGALLVDANPNHGGRFSLVPELADDGAQIADRDEMDAAAIRDAYLSGLVAAVDVAVAGFDSVGNGSGSNLALSVALDWIAGTRWAKETTP